MSRGMNQKFKYLVAFDDYDQKIKHYRVDKMKQIKILEKNSYIHVDVAISPQFFGWILSLGDEVKITGPAKVVMK